MMRNRVLKWAFQCDNYMHNTWTVLHTYCYWPFIPRNFDVGWHSFNRTVINSKSTCTQTNTHTHNTYCYLFIRNFGWIDVYYTAPRTSRCMICIHLLHIYLYLHRNDGVKLWKPLLPLLEFLFYSFSFIPWIRAHLIRASRLSCCGEEGKVSVSWGVRNKCDK